MDRQRLSIGGRVFFPRATKNRSPFLRRLAFSEEEKPKKIGARRMERSLLRNLASAVVGFIFVKYRPKAGTMRYSLLGC